MSNRIGVPEKIRTRLWVLAGGRCQYEGCNDVLWRDELTMAAMNAANIAHIIDVNRQTHRYDPDLSPRLAADLCNLMLLCDKHHRLIDHEEEREHTVDRLTRMKREHEQRIELVTSIQADKKSHVLLYGANIGQHAAPLSWQRAAQAMVPRWYPAESRAIEIGLRNSAFQDDEPQYWAIERQNLHANMTTSLYPRIIAGTVEHLSIFAFAPQPLLMELGRLLSDIPAAEVYQLHREPPDWKWQDSTETFEFIIEEPDIKHSTVALNLSLSAAIDNARITTVMPQEELSIWRMTVPIPNNDFLKSREQLQVFRRQFRLLMDRIKACHGQNATLHVFPAVPVSVAVEIGRVWMPKADLPLCIYDQNRQNGGFTYALTIPYQPRIRGGNTDDDTRTS